MLSLLRLVWKSPRKHNGCRCKCFNVRQTSALVMRRSKIGYASHLRQQIRLNSPGLLMILRPLMIPHGMSIPETTAAEGFERFVGGQCLFHPHGDAWRDLKTWIVDLPLEGHTLPLPSVSEPFLAWTVSGELDFKSANTNSLGSRMHPGRTRMRRERARAIPLKLNAWFGKTPGCE